MNRKSEPADAERRTAPKAKNGRGAAIPLPPEGAVRVKQPAASPVKRGTAAFHPQNIHRHHSITCVKVARFYRADLHIHSCFSDGLNTPDELCRLAVRYSLNALALTDHDTIDGLPEMARAVAQLNKVREQMGKYPLRFFPAVEVSTGEGGRTHLLCYGASVGNPTLAKFLAKQSKQRRERAGEMLRRLQSLGLSLPPNAEEVLNYPTVGRAHLARLLVKCGAAGSVSKAFGQYLNPGCPAYVPHLTPDTRDAIPLLRGMGLVVVLAHPTRLALPTDELSKRLDQWREAGLMGLECYHPSASRSQALALANYARRTGLLVTGGSDYHGEPNTRTRMGRVTLGWHEAWSDVNALKNAVLLAAKQHRG